MASPKVVLANGCFDPFHYGHLLHLQAARTLGEVLIVSVTRDKYVNKGPGRPVFDEEKRAAVIRALACVDEVVLADDALDALQKVDPDVFVKGRDYYGKIEPQHAAYCKARGIRIVFTDGPTWSSTKLLRHYDRLRQG
jgi:rfaE bifunctional protein nucleotidyltransferase chain/domain